MCKFLLAQHKMASGELSPGSLFFNLFLAQAVVVSLDLFLIFGEFLVPHFFQQQLVEKRRLRSQFPLTRLLFDERKILGR
ncbi:MAG TPA: hypothetical protein VLT90_07470 [Terriglobales bacterium]|nr:hypothetical protein [Terriglobales bacterium]